MARFSIGGKRFLLFGLLALLLGGLAVGWAERRAILRWYYLGKLDKAEGEDVGKWAGRVAALGEATVPALLDRLESPEPRAVANAGTALTRLTEGWARDDCRLADLAGRMAKAFPRLAPGGRVVLLDLAATWTDPDRPCPPTLAEALGRLLPEASRSGDDAARSRGLVLAVGLMRRSKEPALLCACRELALLCLKSPDAATRVRAVDLARLPGLNVCQEVVPLLHDPAPEVRRAAVAAVGPAPKVLDTDALLPCLHDPDPEVRRVCEETLLEDRQLQPHHLRLARAISDPNWSARLKVLDHLAEAGDLDPAVWLRRLSHDPSPTVRVAAIRVARDGRLLGDRIEEMARTDPSPEVRDLARSYLRRPAPPSRFE